MALLSRVIDGHTAAQSWQLAKDCPYLATSSSWAAWLYGFGLGSNNAPIHAIKSVTQSRGCSLRVVTAADVQIVPFPKAVL